MSSVASIRGMLNDAVEIAACTDYGDLNQAVTSFQMAYLDADAGDPEDAGVGAIEPYVGDGGSLLISVRSVSGATQRFKVTIEEV